MIKVIKARFYLPIFAIFGLIIGVGCIGGGSKSENIEVGIKEFEISTSGAGTLDAKFNVSYKQNDTFEQHDDAEIDITVTMTTSEGSSGTTITYTVCDFTLSKDKMEDDSTLASYSSISDGVYKYNSGPLLGKEGGITLESDAEYQAIITVKCNGDTWEESKSLNYQGTTIS